MQNIQRRTFAAQTAALAAGLAGLATAPAARAQNTPVEGQHYVRLQQTVPTNAPTGKLEVIEFFWYGCPHCNAFEPMLEGWIRKLPADVAFRRVPVAFRAEPFTTHQKIFFALEAMGQLDAMHRKVFFAIHNEHMKLDKIEDIAAWMGKNGVDAARFTEIANSFAVQTKLRQARQLSEAYKIDGVPALGVNGQYFTSGSLAGSADRMLSVADFLIAEARQKR